MTARQGMGSEVEGVEVVLVSPGELGQLSVVGVEFALVRAVVWVVLGKDDVWAFILARVEH